MVPQVGAWAGFYLNDTVSKRLGESLTNQLQFFPTLCHHHGMKRLKRVNGVIEGGEFNGIHGCRRFRVKAGGVVYSYFGGRKCI